MAELCGLPRSAEEEQKAFEVAYMKKLEAADEQKQQIQKLADAILDMTNVMSQMNTNITVATKNASEANEANRQLQEKIHLLELQDKQHKEKFEEMASGFVQLKRSFYDLTELYKIIKIRVEKLDYYNPSPITNKISL